MKPIITCTVMLLALLLACTHPPKQLEEEHPGMHPQAEDELYLTYRDPATGQIPPGIRQRELAYVRTLPRKSPINFRDGHTGIEWFEAGPGDVGGRTRALVFDKNDPNILLAGAVSGGVWKSTDGGESWVLKSEPGTHLSVTTIVQDPGEGHTHTWYYATGEIRGESGWDRGYRSRNYGSGIYRSIDNGESWQVLPASVPGNPTQWDRAFDFVHRMAVSPVTGTVFVANNGSGIYRSDDGGQTFTLTLGQTSAHLYNDIAVNENGVLLAVQSSLRVNWSHSGTGGIYRSTDDGRNWDNITPASFPAQHHRSVLAIAPSNPDAAYLLTYTGSSFSNGREDIRFHKLNITTGAAEDRTPFLPDFPGQSWFVGPSVATQGSYTMALGVKPDDEDFVVLGGITLFRSTNGFSQSIPSNLNATRIGGYEQVNGLGFPYKYENHWVDQHAVVFHPERTDEMWNGNDSGIYCTRDVTAPRVAWEDKSNGYNVTQFFTVDISEEAGDGRIMGGAQDNGTIYFRDTGTVATPVFTASQEICSGDGSYGYFLGEFVVSSLQFGVTRRQNYLNLERTEIQSFFTFNLVPIGPPPAANTNTLFYIHPYVVDPIDERFMYFPEANTLWRNNNIKATNPLSTWVKLPAVSAPSGYVFTTLAISREPAHVLYLGASHNTFPPRVFRLENANTATNSPEESTLPVATGGAYVHDIAVNPYDANEVLVVLSNYNILGLYHSTDGGRNHTLVEGNLSGSSSEPGPSLRSAAILPGAGPEGETLYLIGTSAGLFSTPTLDGSNTIWEQEAFEQIGNAIAEAIDIRAEDGRIAVATFGRGIFVGNASIPTPAKEPAMASARPQFRLWPNPVKEVGHFQFQLEEKTSVRLSIIDSRGRHIRHLIPKQYFPAGEHTVSLDARGIASGIYWCTLQIGNNKERGIQPLVIAK